MAGVLTVVLRAISIIAIWLGQCAAIYRLYDTPLPYGVRFAIPALLGFVLYLAALRLPLPRHPKAPLPISVIFAVLLGFCSFWMGMFICIYAFGA